MLVHNIVFKITSTHGLVIDVVMIINKIVRCTTVRSSNRIQQKIKKGRRKKICFSIILKEIQGHISRLPTRGAKDEDDQAEYDFYL
jgi:hypothetical protein